MIVSWNWLKQYVLLDMPVAELTRRLMLAGLNHEETKDAAGDLAIDLEVTSNRPDCLGHLGIAREVAVLWGRDCAIPAPTPPEVGPAVDSLTRVEVHCPELCRRYTARVIQGVKIGPAPGWMTRRLATLGIAAINNVVDVTNYVLMECGQPLHAFDLARLEGRRIIVRASRPGEEFLAINHKEYELPPGTVVIADAKSAVGLGGVMGGANSEVHDDTVDLLIESADFTPLAIRNAARALDLRSDSSYRFERGVDPEGVDWASRRACELILETAGGKLARGVIDVGQKAAPREPVVLRLSQLRRILGIEIPAAEVRRILGALGNSERRADEKSVEVVPPSWRRDLTREIDLIEEVARVHGYDAIPEDVSVPMAVSARTDTDRVMHKLRHVLTASGLDEAMTLSLVDEATSAMFSPWTDQPALSARSSIVRGADRLRRSLVPSLLAARRTNESLANPRIELFEIAKVYLPRQGQLPEEPLLLAITSGGGYDEVKGLVEALLAELNPAASIEVRPAELELCEPGRAAGLFLGDERLGYIGELSAQGRREFDLRGPSTVAELRIAALCRSARLVPQYAPISTFPPVVRDLNLVLDEAIRWAAVEATVREAGGPVLEAVSYRDTYRDEKQLGASKKSLLVGLTLRGRDKTLTGEEAEQTCRRVVEACGKKLGATLRG